MTTEDIAAVLGSFRAWLRQAAAAGELAADGRAQEEPLDLHTLLSQLVAVRQEVNLQTRAVRAQQEQNAETLRHLSQALEDLHTAQVGVREVDEGVTGDSFRSVLKGLVDARDALDLARREVERVQRSVGPALEALALAPVPVPELSAEAQSRQERQAGSGSHSQTPGFWSRLFGRSASHQADSPTGTNRDQQPQGSVWERRQALENQQKHAQQAAAAAEQVRESFASVVIGYNMSLERLERTLQECGLEPIHCLGEPFDPELMEVVEVASDSDRPPNEVVEEVRRGYLWRGRVFRYAQVTVARPRPEPGVA